MLIVELNRLFALCGIADFPIILHDNHTFGNVISIM